MTLASSITTPYLGGGFIWKNVKYGLLEVFKRGILTELCLYIYHSFMAQRRSRFENPLKRVIYKQPSMLITSLYSEHTWTTILFPNFNTEFVGYSDSGQ